jgi:hypothetical protein
MSSKIRPQQGATALGLTDNEEFTSKGYVDEAVSGSNFDFFLNDTVSDIGGIYTVMDPNLTGEVESSIVTSGLGVGDAQALNNYATVIGQPSFTELTSGIYDVHLHAARTAGNRGVVLYAELYKRASGGTETLLSTSELSALIILKSPLDLHFTIPSDITILSDDRLVIKLFANVTGGGLDVDVTIYQEGNNASRFSVKTTSVALDNRYLVKSGLATGQTIKGGLTASENLVLDSTAHATKGEVQIEDGNILHANTTNYESLVTDDDDIPNKKYVDDIAGGVSWGDTRLSTTGVGLIHTIGNGAPVGVQSIKTILDNTQSNPITLHRIELGSSAVAHTGLSILAQGLSTGQKGIEVGMGAGLGIGLDISGNSTYKGLRVSGGGGFTGCLIESTAISGVHIGYKYTSTVPGANGVGFYYDVNVSGGTEHIPFYANIQSSPDNTNRVADLFSLLCNRAHQNGVARADDFNVMYLKRSQSGTSSTSTGAILKLENYAAGIVDTSIPLEIIQGVNGQAPPISIAQGRVTSSNFRKIFTETNTDISQWVSNGTNPNGALTGTAGDVCYNGLNNEIYYCTGTTNWSSSNSVSLWDRITGTPNYLIPDTGADEIGATGARIAKGWFADIDSSIGQIAGSLTTGNLLTIVGDSLTSGQLARFSSNSSSSAGRNLVQIVNDNIAATGVTPISITQDAVVDNNYRKIFIETNTNVSQYISNGTDPNGNLAGEPGDVCYNGLNREIYFCTGSNSWTSSSASNIWDRVTGTPNYMLPKTVADEIGGSGNRITKGWFSDLDCSIAQISSPGFTANILTVSGGSLTTGAVAHITSNSGSTAVRNLVEIVNDAAPAVNVTLLSFQQDAVVSTNFRKIFTETNTGISLWISNGATAEGALTGVEGDICLNGGTGAGQSAYCDSDGTNWTDM